MKSMNHAIEVQNKCHDYLDELQPTIDRAVERQGNVLEKRYQSIFNALERANSNLVKYKDSLQSLKNLIDQSDQMQLSLMDVENFKNYSLTLVQDIDKLQNENNDLLQLGDKLKKIVNYKHKELKGKNFDNLIHLREINKTRKQIQFLKTKIEQSSQQEKNAIQEPLPMELSDEDKKLLQQVDNIRQNNKLQKYQIVQSANNYFQKMALFSECLESFKRQLEKTQKIINSNQGMQGSLLFEMKKAKLFLTESDIQLRYQKNSIKPYRYVNKPKSNIQSRQITSLVHDTLKTMLEDREGKRSKYLKDFIIEWDVFRQFNPVQLLGVMSLKPKVFEDVINIMEYKARSIKEEINKHKTTFNEQ